MSLNGKHALITGGSRGIGRGIALKLAEQKVNVAVHYYQNEAAANATLAEVRKLGADGFILQGDVTKPADVSSLFDKVKSEFGKLDIFVANARPEAPTFFQAPLEISVEQWDTAFDSQSKAFLIAAREAANIMPDGGRIIALTYGEGKSHWRFAAMGWHGFSKSRTRITRTILRGRTRQTRHHGQRN